MTPQLRVRRVAAAAADSGCSTSGPLIEGQPASAADQRGAAGARAAFAAARAQLERALVRRTDLAQRRGALLAHARACAERIGQAEAALERAWPEAAPEGGLLRQLRARLGGGAADRAG